ncbi:MAG: thioredoxin family protein [Candidatus Margulisiibacteriota bacterium]
MRRRLSLFFGVLGFILATAGSVCASTVQLQILTQKSVIQAGQKTEIAVVLSIPKGWHIAASTPQEGALPTRLTWTLPKGFAIDSGRWPKPKQVGDEKASVWGYEDRVVVFYTLSAPDTLGKTDLNLLGKWGACNTTCIPEKASLALPIEVGEKGVNALTPFPQEPSTWPGVGILLQNLVLAFLGGLILNAMPCVFPVISIKVLQLISAQKGGSLKSRFVGTLPFAFGIWSSMMVLFGVVVAFQNTSKGLGWGFQLQQPGFVVFLMGLFFTIALSFFGVFEIGLFLTRVQTQRTTGVLGSFLNGVLTTVVATPCSAPVMGAVVGFAFLQSWPVGLLIFTGLALGIAFPYIVLALFPKTLQQLPKSGVWMLHLKQFFGFLMMATVLWLSMVLIQQKDIHLLFLVWTVLLLLGVGLWAYGQLKSVWKWGVILAVVLAGLWLAKPLFIPQPTLDWQPYSKAVFDKNIQEGRLILVDFTAAWCLTCQVNEKWVLSSPEVVKALRDRKVVLLKADWTKQDPAITEALREYGRSGVPLYIFVDRSGKKTILPQVLNSKLIFDLVEYP